MFLDAGRTKVTRSWEGIRGLFVGVDQGMAVGELDSSEVKDKTILLKLERRAVLLK